MKIYAPVSDFNGLRNNIRFVNGVGETDNPSLIDWFIKRGYKVADNGKKADKIITDDVEKLADEPNFEDMTPNELRDWAKANGLGGVIKNTRDKEKLLNLIRG